MQHLRDLPANVAFKGLIGKLTHLDATLTKNTRRGAGYGLPASISASSPSSAPALTVYLELEGPTSPTVSTFNRTHRLHLPLDLRSLSRPPRHFQIVKILQVQPELRVRLEVPRQAQSCFRRDSPPLVHDFPDARRRYMQVQR